ncbi:MAG: hypothetical protein ACI8QZ_001920 [Chlamydiales bacterium]|jgi:hypothetical protein
MPTYVFLISGGSFALTLVFLGVKLRFMGLFVCVATLIVIGGRKFLPGPPQPGDHRILKALLSERAFRAVRDGTREWLMGCTCGHKADLWSAGGVRFKAAGEPRQWNGCPGCGKITWQEVRGKATAERRQIA